MRLSSSKWPAAAACALLLTACGRFGFTDVEAGEQGDDIAAAPSARDSRTNAVEKTGIEVDESDAGPLDEAWGDAGVAPSAAARSGTASSPSVTSNAPSYVQTAAVDCGSIPGVVSCSDFEGGTRGVPVNLVGLLGGQATAPFGTLELNTTRALSTAVAQATIPAISSGPLYVRFSLYAPAGAALDGIGLMAIGIPDVTSGDFGMAVRVENEAITLFTSGDNKLQRGSNAPLPRDRWMCFLVAVESVATRGAVSITIDGQQVLNTSSVDTLPPLGIVGATAGINRTFNNQDGATLLLDNFLVSTQHPGACP